MWRGRRALPVLSAAHHRSARCRGRSVRRHHPARELLRRPAG